MMRLFARGGYQVRLAEGPDDVRAAQKLRYDTFIAERETAQNPGPPGLSGGPSSGLDVDAFDAVCDHVLIEDKISGAVICCFRLLPLETGADIFRSYSAQYYDLSALEAFPDKMVEMGRFCIHPDHRNADVLRIAWATMTRYVEERGVELLFGCSSFQGVEAQDYLDAFALLKERHLAPPRWLPRMKAPKVFQFAKNLRLRRPNMVNAMKRMPPLLRGYLSLGGWVSDHAVVDHDMNTLHVFTGLEVKKAPRKKVELLRRA